MNDFETSYSMYKHAVESITMCFARKYFGEDYRYQRSDWVGQEIGGSIHMNDYMFNFDEMLGYLKYGYTKKQMFEHYDYDLEERTNGNSPVCIRDWKKMKKGV